MKNLMPLKPIDRSIFDGQINRNNLSDKNLYYRNRVPAFSVPDIYKKL